MTKAIIFDCFGVLTTDAWLPFKQQHFGDNPELLEEATTINKQADSGLISQQQFFEKIAALANMSVDETWHTLRNNVPNEPLFDIIRSLKPSYKIGMLSNVSSDYLKELFSEEHRGLFDEVALSFETGFIKPQPEAYEQIAERLGCAPEECVFIDDQERSCTGAREVGMPAIWYQNFDQCQADLEKALSQSGK